ncbi:MAG: ribosome biogenesis GTP-binding protein YihA/YsxC [Actinomycetota bacterium]
MPGPLQLEFVKSAQKLSELPLSTAEVAFVGRSNVGKSSLINALANRKQLAKVSNTPGRTQLINLFSLRGGGTVVDLPGYGFAKVPERERVKWQPMIEGYLLGRESLRALLLLLDGEIGPTKLDLQMIDWLNANEVPAILVATKLDKVRPSKLAGRKQQVAKACEVAERDVLWVSASKGTGIDQLRSVVTDLLADD